MENINRVYIAIDLKSFYASVECVARGLNPMTTNLVVADGGRTEKTICLAVSPSLKSYGISGRARLFEVIERVAEINALRKSSAKIEKFSGSSFVNPEVAADPTLELGYITAPPQMARYMAVSTQIFKIYLRYVSAADILVYSIDEVFIDATGYLAVYGGTAHELAMKMIRDVLRETGITATAGIGTNMYLCKVAMDIVAKHMPADADGVRIAELDERSYRRLLWNHRPLTDFWRLGRGYAKKLESIGLNTMGDIARFSLTNDEHLYRLFGVNAELLIDHAWGWEPCTIADVKAYVPESKSVSTGQVLHTPYDCEKTRLIVREMADMLSLDLVDKGLTTDQIVLTVGYDVQNLRCDALGGSFRGEIVTDAYGRKLPKQAHGTLSLGRHTASTRAITDAALALFDRIIDPTLLTRRICVVAGRVLREEDIPESEECEQLDFFTDAAEEERRRRQSAAEEREKRRQQAILKIQKRFGKNAIFKGMNLQEGATTKDRNGQIGGPKA